MKAATSVARQEVLPGQSDDDATQVLRGLREAAVSLAERGVPVPALEGKLLRPLVAYALVPPALRGNVDPRFWLGALAVQMVHEASLLHDDILDGASERRGRETLAASKGVGPALVLGDHYLTGAYRAAAAVGSPRFLECFIAAVERTVAGEVAQARAIGRRLTTQEYRDIVTGKSGELFGATTALAGALFELGSREERVQVGRDMGALYQQVDDLLDCCPAAETGKPPLQDYRQGKWTWVLGLVELDDFDLKEDEVLARLFMPRDGAPSAARRAVAQLKARRDVLVRRVAKLSPGDTLAAQALDGWVQAAERGVQAQEEELRVAPPRRAPTEPSRHREVAALARKVGGPSSWPALFGRHAKTFRFASRLFPAEPAALIAGVYAYCRFTDDLVDEPADDAPVHVLRARLDAWAEMSREAFEGRTTDVPLLDEVLGEAGRRGVTWRYPDALLSGVGMDLGRVRVRDWSALEEYTFGVAGAVGGWITQLFGIHDPTLLQQAHALGHGMQLTNIARDVGEDLERDRVYLPADVIRDHGLSVEDLRSLRRSSGPMPPEWISLMEELLARADAYYEEAWPGIRALPDWYARPVAVAAEAYRGIHREIRRSGFDSLRRRAHTSTAAKLRLGLSALVRSHG